MKSVLLRILRQGLVATLVVLPCIALRAEPATPVLQVDLQLEDIDDWSVAEDLLWLQLSESALMHLHGLEEASMGQRVLVSLEGEELLTAKWYLESDTRTIVAPASQAVLLLLQNSAD